MNKQVEACVVIKSSENSAIEYFYLLCIKGEYMWDRNYIFFDLSLLRNLNKGEELSLASCIDILVKCSGIFYYPLSKTEYDNFISNSSIKYTFPYYFVRVDKEGDFDVTYSHGMSINYSLQEWDEIAGMIRELEKIVTYDTFFNDDNCPCFKCLVQVTCLVKHNYVNGDKVVFRAARPCRIFYIWKKDRFLEIWNALPDDIRQLEHNIYDEMLLKASAEN